MKDRLWNTTDETIFGLQNLREAIANREFYLEYLPTVSLKDSQCVGAEALVRWQHGAGTLMPMEFIPLFENTPLIGYLTCWVIETVAEELGTCLQGKKKIHVGINVPPEVIGRGALAYVADKCGLLEVADRVMLEVTERGSLDSMGLTALSIKCPKLLFALDDVADESANFLLMSRTPINFIKLQKEFTDTILRQEWPPEEFEELSLLINTGKLQVIAEGVEVPEQANVLRDAGVQMAQGWLFSPSLPARDFLAYFAAH